MWQTLSNVHKKRIFCIMILCILLSLLESKGTEAATATKVNLNTLFYQANGYYENGDYTKAAATYEQILQTGYGSGSLYYNLGNTYYRLGEKGRALVNYLRAQMLIPRDPDLRSNLEHIKEELKLVDPGQGFRANLSEFLTIYELTFSINLFLTVLMILLFCRLVLPKIRQFLKIPFMIVLLCLVLSIIGAVIGIGDFLTDVAIVVNEATARFEPSASGEVFYTLSVGSNVTIADKREGWYLVKRTDGKKGWVKTEDIEPLKVNKKL